MTVKKYIIPLFFILIIASDIYSLDLTTSFNVGNFGFSSDMGESSLGIPWGSSIEAVHRLDDDQFKFFGKVVADEVTGNRIDSRFLFNSTYIVFGIGPSIASINNNQLQIKPALNALVRVKKNGSFSFTTEIYSTLGNLADRQTDYSQLETMLELSMHIPGAICSFIISNKQFTRFTTDTSSIISKTTDNYSLYALKTDLYKNMIPFHLILTLGYKNYKRHFPADDITGRSFMGIGSAFVEVGTSVNIGRKIILKASVDSGLYNFTLSDELAVTDLPDYLFNIKASFTYKF